MSVANLADGFHAKHSRLASAQMAEVWHTRGGQNWTLITPETWSLLHAVLHSRAQ
jgi:hypothetical protein